MATSEELINFDIIEEHKENIQALPGGRSAKALARILSPLPSIGGRTITREDTQNFNETMRQQYEIELQEAAEHDDPLDIYQRYVKWTLDTWPSAQNDPQSRLLPLLERATKAFLSSTEYKNDPRYFKLWLHYIRLFSDAPRETFAYLARHGIAQQLALFYEEFAAWLENAGRWTQADEVYKLGIEREARPVERLVRRYGQFQHRFEARPVDQDEHNSPALPKVRAALAAKIDPFAPHEERTPQQTTPAQTTTKPKKQKMTIFSDSAADVAPVADSAPTKGWDSIGSIKDRKKENTIEARPWTGQTLKAGKKLNGAPKMEVFKDTSQKLSVQSVHAEQKVNPRTGRAEAVFVNLDAVYSKSGSEYSFEELRAASRGWMDVDWAAARLQSLKREVHSHTQNQGSSPRSSQTSTDSPVFFEMEHGPRENTQSSNGSQQQTKPSRQKKIKVREVRQETQTVRTRLDSPSKPRLRKRAPAEPTMTLHSKAAQNDIFDMYNHASKPPAHDDTQSGPDSEGEDDTFSVAGESTGHISGTNSEYGDETGHSFGASEDTSNSHFGDFNTTKLNKILAKTSAIQHAQYSGDDLTSNFTLSQEQSGFDTQAIAAIAAQDFDLNTMAISSIAKGMLPIGNTVPEVIDLTENEVIDLTQDEDDLRTPIEDEPGVVVEVEEQQRFVPIQPEDYEPTPLRPWRDSTTAAYNKLPFMTPIAEQTESSLAPSTIFQKALTVTKTPSRLGNATNSAESSPSKLLIDDLLLDTPPRSGGKRRSSGAQELTNASDRKKLRGSPELNGARILFPLDKPKQTAIATTLDLIDLSPSFVSKAIAQPTQKTEQASKPIHKGPIILDLQCNPCDQTVIEQILEQCHPPVSSYTDFYDHRTEDFCQFSHIRSYAQKVARQSTKTSPRKSQNTTKLVQPLLEFKSASSVYAIKRELGEGAFAPVYLADKSSSADSPDVTTVAIKAEPEPRTLTWEFHILHLLKTRLGAASDAMQSIIQAESCHLYRDECYLILSYHSQGTLLDLVNAVRADNASQGKPADTGLDEPVAILLSIALLRTVEDCHRVGILHGDLKADNCLVRFSPHDLSDAYTRHSPAWAGKGLTLIDFGRSIDTRAFAPATRFIADWAATATDCPEIRSQRPWKWEIDLYGLAATIHSMLFGKYIDTVPVAPALGPAQKPEWRLRDPLKRYWEKDIWGDVFATLVNCNGIGASEAQAQLKRLRAVLEEYLEREGEKSSKDLRGAVRRCERLVGRKEKERR